MKKSMLLIMTLLVLGCASTKEQKVIKFSQKENVFDYAISDFIKNCSLYKKDSVFSISFHDTIYGYVLEKVDNPSYSHMFVVDTIYENLIAISISGNGFKWLHGKYNKQELPSRYVEVDGKLFYFMDYDYELSEEAVKVFSKYNLLEDDDDGFKKMADDISIDDSKKGAHYYFCKNNILKYKRVITNIGMGHYKPPKLKCD